jgi:hypothetical protein
MPSDDKPSFTVTDRRAFTGAGETRDQDDASPAGGEPSVTALPGGAGVRLGSPAEAGEGGPGLPAVDFHTFVLSLGSSALLHLGELDHPDGGQSQTDLGLAKHTIDIISMLQEKTRGNLMAPEDKLIESLLYDLRLRYVEKSKGSGKPGKAG